jgi:lipopolysaccharide transport system ATP-binding protein
MSTAIKVENLSKIYRLGEIGTGTISRDIERYIKTRILKQEDPFLKIGETNNRAEKGSSDIVYSLKDINFEIQEGDSVGIIGKNGSGKSTLLKLLSRITAPTGGVINIKGRVASLLEVGTGFHPELTGRENIYLNGAILGMRKSEIDKKLHEIIEFSGVERYIDTPVKRYSSGMYVRLAFAVAAFLESEILIVDEVLAVGDFEFQEKCLGRMNDISNNEGRTVLFVSHNISSINKLCNSIIYLNDGNLIDFSYEKEYLINKYLNLTQQINFYWSSNKKLKQTQNISHLESFISNRVEKKYQYNNSEDIYITTIFYLQSLKIPFHVSIIIYSQFGHPLMRLYDIDFKNNNYKLGENECVFKIPRYILAVGRYDVEIDIAIPNVERFSQNGILLGFEIKSTEDIGNMYNYENSLTANSIIRPDFKI